MKSVFATLAAVAAITFTVPAARASMDVYPFEGMIVFGGMWMSMDLNGDDIEDVAFDTDLLLLEGVYNPVADATSGFVVNATTLSNLAPGARIGPEAQYGDVANYAALVGDESNLIGFSFFIEGERHYGWMKLLIEDSYLTLETIAWESRAGVAVYAGVIPEPSDIAIGGGLLAAAAVLWRRRRLDANGRN